MQLTARYTQEQLVQAVATSSNIRQVCLKLGLRGRGANYDTIRRHIAQLNLDTSHFRGSERRTIAVQRQLFDEPLRVGRTDLSATREQLEVAVASSRSLAEIARRLGLDPRLGGTYRRLHVLIDKYRLDTSHIRGQGWSKDQTVSSARATPIEDVLVAGRPHNSSNLRQRLVGAGLKQERCEGCGRDWWQGHPIPLELDHINGDRHDNRLENLRLICPNCHALTDNYRGRNIGRK